MFVCVCVCVCVCVGVCVCVCDIGLCLLEALLRDARGQAELWSCLSELLDWLRAHVLLICAFLLLPSPPLPSPPSLLFGFNVPIRLPYVCVCVCVCVWVCGVGGVCVAVFRSLCVWQSGMLH